MRIGLDLDNTIIRYDGIFHAVAVERGLISAQTTVDKHAVKSAVIETRGPEAWTHLQAEVYGPLLTRAESFPGVENFVVRCRHAGIAVCIISHKTQYPAVGQPHDLRESALQWLEQHGWFLPAGPGLSRQAVEFHGDRTAKVHAIRRRRCDLFVDDLPEVFAHPEFPATTLAMLFDPSAMHVAERRWQHARSWAEIEEAVFAGVTP